MGVGRVKDDVDGGQGDTLYENGAMDPQVTSPRPPPSPHVVCVQRGGQSWPVFFLEANK